MIDELIIVFLCTTKWGVIVRTSYYCMSNYEAMSKTNIVIVLEKTALEF